MRQYDLFRRKASVVATANEYLAQLDAPKANAYMIYRAVQAAKIDFDATPKACTRVSRYMDAKGIPVTSSGDSAA